MAWIVVFLVSRSEFQKALPEEQRALRQAEAAYAASVKQAKGVLGRTTSDWDRAVADAESALGTAKEEGSRKLASYGPVALYEHALQTPEGTAMFEQGQVQTSVSTSGAIRNIGGKSVDQRQCFLTIQAPGFQSVVPCGPNDEARVRQLAASIVNASIAWPGVQSAAAENVAVASKALHEMSEGRSHAVAVAEQAHAEAVADTGSLYGARAAAGVAYCSACRRNVIKSPDGLCSRGHGSECLSEEQPGGGSPLGPKRKVTRAEAALLAGAVLGVLMACGGVAASPVPNPSTSVPRSSQPATTQATTSKPIPVPVPVSIKVQDLTSSDTKAATLTVALVFEPSDAQVLESVDSANWTPVAGATTPGQLRLEKPLQVGDNVFYYKAVAPDGREATTSVTTRYTPDVQLTLADLPSEVAVATVKISGSATPGSAVKVKGTAVAVSPTGAFSFNAPLVVGGNELIVVAEKAGYVTSSKTLSVSRTESEAEYKKSCISVKWAQLDKNPDAYKGKRLVYRGQIFNISEDGGITTIQMNVTSAGYGFWSDQVIVVYPAPTRFVKDDVIKVWGECTGAETYQSVAGWDITVPAMLARYVGK
jgi:hypothetical protein